jgi:hypothetical protein
MRASRCHIVRRSFVASVSDDHAVRLWAWTGALLQLPEMYIDWLISATFSPDRQSME